MNEFEKTSNDTMSEYSDARDMRENVIYWLNGDKECTVNFTQVKYISKVKRMAEKYPDRVKIDAIVNFGDISFFLSFSTL